MSFDFGSWSTAVRSLCDALAALGPQAAAIGAPLPERDEWYQLLLHKLRPQSFGTPPLVVAVVGGTNIGKSAIFNQLAGEDASSVSPMAAGTKHPVCLCPTGTNDPQLLHALFSEFKLLPWSAAADALGAADEHLLFWRESPAVPERLLLLDTPDIDSDAQVNWQRADAVRQTADVLIGVLTQQKYYDAAVKKFFTRAAEADKAVILVFNQIDLALDRDIWPTWLDDFCRSTGVRPVRIYVVPYDRKGAQSRGLTFYDLGPEIDSSGRAAEPTPTDLGRELADLRYEELKARTLRGALRRVVDPVAGVERYLGRVREVSREYAAAFDELGKACSFSSDWPSLPDRELIHEAFAWWDARRHVFTRTIHGFYGKVAKTAVDLYRLVVPNSGEALDVWEEYRRKEESNVGRITEQLLGKLESYATIGDAIVRDRLKVLLGGDSRRRMHEEVTNRYGRLPPIQTRFREVLSEELNQLEQEYPKEIAKYRKLDLTGAVMRPVLSVAFFGTGLDMVAIDVIAAPLVGEAATMAVAGGAPAVTRLVVKRAIAARFNNVQKRVSAERADELLQIFNDVILGNLMADLGQGASVATGPEMRAATEATDMLRKLST